MEADGQRPSTDDARPFDATSGRQSFVVTSHGDAPAVRLAITELGSRRDPAVVLAHGAGSSARFLQGAFAGPMRAAGLRLVTFDLRGHGGSGYARLAAHHHLDVHASDLAEVVAATAGEVAVVGGVSLGAHAAVRSAAKEHWRARAVLACLPAWSGRAPAGEGPHAAVAAEVREVGIAGSVARLRSEPGLPAWLRATLVEDYTRHDAASLEAALIALDGGVAPTLDELERLPAPLAVVAWPDDPGHPLVVAQRWAAQRPGDVLEVLELAALDAGTDALGSAACVALQRLTDGSELSLQIGREKA